MRRLLSALSTVVLLAAFVGWMVYLRPAPLGGPATFVIVSGTSMEPRLHDGDLVVVRRQDSYSPGDVVAFQVPEGEPGAGAMVIHRIVGGSARSGFRMRGDNKALADLWRPRDGDIVGRPWLEVPRAGRMVTTLGSPIGAGTAAGLLVFLYVLTGGAPPSSARNAVPRPVPPFTPL
ncbi:MAG TPA: signal peptidase I [Nocardioidaceae bacterium]|nr:signal peptidase I [Nocardioidaceae bacterium]